MAFSGHTAASGNSFEQAARIGPARAGQRQCRAVINRSADDGQAQRHVDTLAERGVLQRGQALVVHGEHGIALGENGWRKHRVSRIGAGQMHALGAQLIENRRNDLDFFHTEITTFAGMRIEAGNEDARLG
jgi:hypothetical protein